MTDHKKPEPTTQGEMDEATAHQAEQARLQQESGEESAKRTAEELAKKDEEAAAEAKAAQPKPTEHPTRHPEQPKVDMNPAHAPTPKKD